MVAAPDAPLGGRADGARRVLVRVEAGDEDVREEEQALAAVVVLAEAAQDARGNDFAERGARPVDVLAVARVGLLVEELGAIDQQAVDYKKKGERFRRSVSILGSQLWRAVEIVANLPIERSLSS